MTALARHRLALSGLLLLPLSPLAAQAQAPESDTPAPARDTQAAPAPAPADRVTYELGALDNDQLYELGKALFESYAPEDIKRDYEFPSKEQWESFVPRLQKALEGNSMADLAALETDARNADRFLAQFDATSELRTWLHERLDLIEAARDFTQAGKRDPGAGAAQPPKPRAPSTDSGQATQTVQGTRPVDVPPQPRTTSPVPATPPAGSTHVPAYEYWYEKISKRPTPPAAHELMPMLSTCFQEERSPVELAWLAEVESTFNPAARSPAGATGLYQLMPATARGLGLSTSMPDERTHPEKNARAAARLLRSLHKKFGDWPLALAAYNAGEGRIRRLLAKHKATDFAGIADALPVETRLYVPKVLATVATRTGLALH